MMPTKTPKQNAKLALEKLTVRSFRIRAGIKTGVCNGTGFGDDTMTGNVCVGVMTCVKGTCPAGSR